MPAPDLCSRRGDWHPNAATADNWVDMEQVGIAVKKARVAVTGVERFADRVAGRPVVV